MKIASLTAVFVVLAVSPARVTDAQAQQPTVQYRAVDLDELGVLEALQRSNPAHYEKVPRCLAGSGRTSTGATSPMARSC